MKCLKCNKKEKVKGFEFCRNCFISIIEKRVRKELRVSEAIKRGDALLIIDDRSCSAKLNIQLIKKIVGDITEIKVKKQKSFDINKKIDFKGKVIVPWNLDDEIILFMKCFLNNVPFKNLGNHDNSVKPLLCLKKDECELYCKLLGIKFEQKKTEENKDIIEFVDKIEKKYPGSKFSILKSSKQML
jgi:hypothetical protein